MFSIHEQYLDLEAGFHVIKLRDGKKEHLVQIAVGHNSCPACGAVYPKDLEGIVPAAAVAQVVEALNSSHANMHEYAKRHGIPIK